MNFKITVFASVLCLFTVGHGMQRVAPLARKAKVLKVDIMHYARTANIARLRELREQGVSFEFVEETSRSNPLLCALDQDDEDLRKETVKFLVEKSDIDVNYTTPSGLNALRYALLRGDVDTATVLLDLPHIIVTKEVIEEPFLRCIRFGEIACAVKLAQKNPALLEVLKRHEVYKDTLKRFF